MKGHSAPVPVANGSFEDGLAGWEIGGTLMAGTSRNGAHAGDMGILLGSPDYPCDPAPAGESWLAQRITVPPGGIPRLRLWYRIVTYDRNRTLSDTRDFLEVEAAGVQVVRVMRLTGEYGCPLPAEDLGWRQAEADLSAWRGEEIELRLLLHTDSYANTWAYLDEIAVK